MREHSENFCNPALGQYSVISISFCIITNSGRDSSLLTVPPLTKVFYSASKCFSIFSDASVSSRHVMAMQQYNQILPYI